MVIIFAVNANFNKYTLILRTFFNEMSTQKFAEKQQKQEKTPENLITVIIIPFSVK